MRSGEEDPFAVYGGGAAGVLLIIVVGKVEKFLFVYRSWNNC